MTPVDLLNDEYKSIIGFLDEKLQPSLSNDVNKNFKKILILASASYFEYLIKEILVKFVEQETRNNPKAVNFFKKKAIGLQYHTFFVWGEKDNPLKPGKNANAFFALFGDEFKKNVESDINSDSELENAVKAFLEVGHLRNLLIHSNFASYSLENKTSDEIYKLYSIGLKFVVYFNKKLLML